LVALNHFVLVFAKRICIYPNDMKVVVQARVEALYSP
jgi:hypothetical protein